MNIPLIGNPRFWVAAAALALLIVLRMTALGDVFSLSTLEAHGTALHAWARTNDLLASAAYVAMYIVVVSLSIPGATVLTLAGGFLFGGLIGTLLTALGATLGATVIFRFANVLFAADASAHLAERYPTLISGIRENSWAYLLVLRLVPLFPFFIVNLVPTFVGIRLSTYIVTTFFGILPATAVYAFFGSGIGIALAQSHSISVNSVMTPTILLSFFGLAALSLAAIPIRKRLIRPRMRQTAAHGS